MKALLILTRKTVHDLLFERILYNVFFVAIFLLFFGYLAALLVFGHQDRVMMHFGTMVNALSIFVVSATAGARIIQTEIEQRTAYLVLVRPVSRTIFYLSKFKGLTAFTLINLALLSLVLMVGLKLTGGAFNFALFQATSLIYVESLVVAAFALLVAQFLRPGLTVMVTLAYFFVAHNHEQIQFIQTKQGAEAPAFLSAMSALTPNAQVFLMDTRAYYEMPLMTGEWVHRAEYGVLWALVFLIIGNAVFNRRTI